MKGRKRISLDLSPGRWVRDAHLEYDQLVRHADGRADAVEHEVVAAHVEVCGRCRVDVASFLDHRRRTGPELKVRYAPDEQSVLAKPLRELWTRVGAGLRLAYTAGWAVILTSIVLLLITSVYESRRARDLRSEKAGLTEAVAPVADPPASSAPSPAVGGPMVPRSRGPSELDVKDLRPGSGPAGESRPERESLAETVSLNDGPRVVRLDHSGAVTGLGDMPAATRQLITDTLVARDIARPKILGQLAGERSVLRGSSGDSPFRPLSPGGIVVAEDRPTFSWEAMKGATGYRVVVADLDGHAVLDSGELAPAATRWISTTPLRRGVIYNWVVSALVNGESITSPAPPEPEMKFKVLDGESARELARLKRGPGSPLALGLFYARAGMVADAEKELRLLAVQNPASPLAARLLRRVQSWR